jgi:GDP-L-fucose synthase
MLDLRATNILVTGGGGFIGKAVVEDLIRVRNVDARRIVVPDSKKDDLRERSNCLRLMRDHRIDVVIHLATKVGGVGYSSKFPATQYYNNILMDLQVVEAARETRVKKIVMTSSACAYPLDTSYPMVEDNVWNGLPQETNLAYGIGKRIQLVQADAYRKEFGTNIVTLLPNNAYGPWDNFHPEYSHVIPSLIRKCLSTDAQLVVWGDGTPTRDFLYVKDFADAVIAAAERLESPEPVNVGSGVETRISALVNRIVALTGYRGSVLYDHSKPNGQPRRFVNIDRARTLLGWTPRYTLEVGLQETVEWYKRQHNLV